MSAVLAVAGLAVVFYFLHQMHGRMGNAAERGASAARPPEPAGPEGATRGGLGWGVVLLLTLILVLPLMLLHSVIPAGSPMHAVLFWIALLLPLLILPFVLPTSHAPGADGTASEAEGAGTARETEWRRQRLALVGPLGDCIGRELAIEGTRYEDELIVFEGSLGRLARALSCPPCCCSRRSLPRPGPGRCIRGSISGRRPDGSRTCAREETRSGTRQVVHLRHCSLRGPWTNIGNCRGY